MRLRPSTRPIHVGLALCLFAALAPALGGCSMQDPLTNDRLRERIAPGTARKSVAVVSGIGETFTVQTVGVMVFGNARDAVAIDAWGIDNLVVRTVGNKLSGRFDVKRLTYPKGVFASVGRRQSILDAEYKDYREELRDVVRGLAASQKADLYVVVTQGASQYGNSNQYLGGLGS
jgi:hypothetical protein